MTWKPLIKKNNIYILKIPDTSKKHRESRALLHNREVKVLDKINSHRGHGIYKVRVMSINGFPSKFPKEFKMWGPYLCCNCPQPYGCTCGGY